MLSCFDHQSEVSSRKSAGVCLASVAGALAFRGQPLRKVKIEYESKEAENSPMPGLSTGTSRIAWSRLGAGKSLPVVMCCDRLHKPGVEPTLFVAA